jgi:hypothetical protein
MSSYTLLIYEEPLTEHECEQISNICYDAKLEKMNEPEAYPISCGQDFMYNEYSIAVCYRLYGTDGIESIRLIGKDPKYIGQINEDLEARCIALAKLWLHLVDKVFSVDDIREAIHSIVKNYKDVFQKDALIDCESVMTFEREYRDILHEVEEEVRVFFEKNAFKLKKISEVLELESIPNNWANH